MTGMTEQELRKHLGSLLSEHRDLDAFSSGDALSFTAPVFSRTLVDETTAESSVCTVCS